MVDRKNVARTRRIVEEFVFCLFRGEKVMPVLHYIPPSPPCRCVLLLGRLINIEFDLRLVDLMKGEHLKPEFIEVRNIRYTNRKIDIQLLLCFEKLLQINPQHILPTLEDHGLVLWERY